MGLLPSLMLQTNTLLCSGGILAQMSRGMVAGPADLTVVSRGGMWLCCHCLICGIEMCSRLQLPNMIASGTKLMCDAFRYIPIRGPFLNPHQSTGASKFVFGWQGQWASR